MMALSGRDSVKSRFMRTVAGIKKGSCVMELKPERTASRGKVERSIPSTRMDPLQSSIIWKRARIKELFPLLGRLESSDCLME